MIRKHLLFSGRVQGVGFRYSAMYLARPLGLTGWVRNLWDGRVEMEAQGSPEAIDSLISQLSNHRYIRVDDVEEMEIPVQSDRGFRIM